MRKALLILLSACLVGCATKHPAPSKPDPAAAAMGLPDPANKLTPQQITQLKSRLDQLRVGMSRARVMEILDLSSFNVRSYADTSSTGITYNIEHGHILTLALDSGDYDSTLRWARFDSEMWPKHDAGRVP